MGFTQAVTLKREWEPRNAGVVLQSCLRRSEQELGLADADTRAALAALVHGRLLCASEEAGGAAYEVASGDTIVHLADTEAHTLRAGPDGLEVLAYGQRMDTETSYHQERADKMRIVLQNTFSRLIEQLLS